jgi:hypothetical protein
MSVWVRGLVCAALVVAALNGTSGQEMRSRGQNIAPVFEGWEPNPDGTFNIVFGYFNRNFDEKLHVPVGPGNGIEPGGPDQGQPTYFFPRRNHFTFRVRVPKDFGKKELVWTLTVHGKTEKAYASLRPEYLIDDEIMMLNIADIRGGEATNNRPVVRVEGAERRSAKVGEPVLLTAVASDDGRPKPRAAPPPSSAIASSLGLRVAWFVYRGPGDTVAFDPPQFKTYPDYRSDSPWTEGWVPPPLPSDGKFPVKATFGEAGSYVIRVMAHDGGLMSTQDVAVDVR